jgi:glycosyltransferase involved in cell wall biosynthesis
MHLFVNGLAASAGGGLTYLRNVAPELSKRPGVRTTIALNSALQHEFEGLSNVSCVNLPSRSGALHRFWREQTNLGRMIRDSGADVLISAGNFALRGSPVPQILLSRNSLYTSPDFFLDLRCRREYRILADTYLKSALAKRSLEWADCAVAPTKAFARELHAWTGSKVKTIHHGFDRERFFKNQRQLPGEIQAKLDTPKEAIRLLFVSHYNYYRNFETLFRAIPILQQCLGARQVKLLLTCKLVAGNNPGIYRTETAAALVRKLNVTNSLVELGTVPYELLHQLYGSCHIYVTAAYAETFAHPLVEAMACGLPVVASDLDVHREVCGDAALYFARFSPEELAARVAQIANSQGIRAAIAAKGIARSRAFSWEDHVDRLLALAQDLRGAEDQVCGEDLT